MIDGEKWQHEIFCENIFDINKFDIRSRRRAGIKKSLDQTDKNISESLKYNLGECFLKKCVKNLCGFLIKRIKLNCLWHETYTDEKKNS